MKLLVVSCVYESLFHSESTESFNVAVSSSSREVVSSVACVRVLTISSV